MRPWWDAFAGGLSMSVELAQHGPGMSTDINAALIATYAAVRSGWMPPTTVSERDYELAKNLADSDPIKAFVGFGCSFGGKWFGGYARSPDIDRNYAASAARAVVRDVAALSGCRISHVDFLSVMPHATDCLLYLDPPYEDTTGYGGAPTFDNARFRQLARRWSMFTDVFVSEYRMPGRPLLEYDRNLSVQFGGEIKGGRRERLYHYSPSNPMP